MKLPITLALSLLLGASTALAQTTPAAPANQAPANAAEATASGPDLQVTVLETGTDPKLLRLQPKAGTAVTMKITTDMSMTSTMGGNPLPAQPIPTMIMSLKQTIESVDGDGAATCKVQFTAFQVEDKEGGQPGMAAMIRQMMNGLVGITGQYTISNRGISSPVKWTFGADVPPMIRNQMESMSQSMDQFSLPLPKDPIGDGGKWKIVGTIEAQGIKLQQTRTVTLVKRHGTIVDLTIAVDQTAAPQDVALPNGQKMHVDSMDAQGTGEVSLDLTMLGAAKATSHVEQKSKMEIDAGPSGKQMLTQDATVHVQIVTQPAG